MKRLLIILAAAMMAVGAMAEGHLKFKGGGIDKRTKTIVYALPT